MYNEIWTLPGTVNEINAIHCPRIKLLILVKQDFETSKELPKPLPCFLSKPKISTKPQTV